MPPILTVTLNPALDLAGAVPRVVAGPKLRVGELSVEPGGGGINVARVIHRLGGAVIALAALGGPTGARLASLLEAEGVAMRVLETEGDTRESLAITDRSDGAQYRFVLPGPEWGADAEAAALDAIVEAAPEDGWVVLSGSQPPGVAADFPQRLVRALTPRARLLVDTSGASLDRLLRDPEAAARPAVLRLDHREAEAIAGGPLEDAADSLDLACDLVARGVAETVVMARAGADGSVLAAPDLRLHATPPRVEVASAVGAGDSFTAAFTLSLAQGTAPGEALRHGTAAAAAAVTTPATELCRAGDVARLLPHCRVATA